MEERLTFSSFEDKVEMDLSFKQNVTYKNSDKKHPRNPGKCEKTKVTNHMDRRRRRNSGHRCRKIFLTKL